MLYHREHENLVQNVFVAKNSNQSSFPRAFTRRYARNRQKKRQQSQKDFFSISYGITTRCLKFGRKNYKNIQAATMMTAQHVVPERLDAEDVADLQEPLLGGSNESSVVPVCEDDFSCLRPIPFDVTQRLQSAAEVAIRDLMDGSSLFDTQEELPSLTLDPSKVGRRLGQGGYCCVYEYGETQAIKCLSDEAILSSQLTIGMTDLVREAHILSVLNHPSIIHVHGVADHEQHYFVVLDRVRQTLWDHVQKQPSETRAITLLEFVQRLEWGLQIAQALQYLHSEKSIVYRDLKLDNIGIDDKGNVKLMGEYF
jgi:hypothetical protein